MATSSTRMRVPCGNAHSLGPCVPHLPGVQEVLHVYFLRNLINLLGVGENRLEAPERAHRAVELRQGTVFRVPGSGCRVQGAGCRVQRAGQVRVVEAAGCHLGLGLRWPAARGARHHD